MLTHLGSGNTNLTTGEPAEGLGEIGSKAMAGEMGSVVSPMLTGSQDIVTSLRIGVNPWYAVSMIALYWK